MSTVQEPVAVSAAPSTSTIPNGLPLPSKTKVLSVIPADCFERSFWRSTAYLAMSLSLTVGLGVFAYQFIPLHWAWIPAWLAYSVACGTAATGCWVVAHECGHRAYCRQAWLQDLIGFTVHSALLVPYFSWQRSHAVHHARTNHLDKGETHVPRRNTDASAGAWSRMQHALGDEAFGIGMMIARLTVGWPLYLLVGATGGPVRDKTNHFWPVWPFSSDLFPGRWRAKVWISDLGVVAVLALLVLWAWNAGSVWPVVAVYLGPYLVVNFWLVLYTWLQHTDPEVPHFEDDEWTWVRGAFMTIDRPYGRLLDLLHHRIGSTHVAHHIEARIPHYHAQRATVALREAFPDLYLYDPTPIHRALLKTALTCHAVGRSKEGWTFAAANEAAASESR